MSIKQVKDLILDWINVLWKDFWKRRSTVLKVPSRFEQMWIKCNKKKKTKWNPESCVTSRLNSRCAVIKSGTGTTKGCYISFSMVKPASSDALSPGTLISGHSKRCRRVLTPLSTLTSAPGTSGPHIWLRLQASRVHTRHICDFLFPSERLMQY